MWSAETWELKGTVSSIADLFPLNMCQLAYFSTLSTIFHKRCPSKEKSKTYD